MYLDYELFEFMPVHELALIHELSEFVTIHEQSKLMNKMKVPEQNKFS